MKPIKSLLVLGIFVALPLFSASTASAQAPGYGPGYGGPPPNSVLPGGFHNRMGRLAFGFSGGLGGMHDNFGDISCDNCDTVSGELDGHIGGFVSPQLAILFEVQLNFQQLSQGDLFNEDIFLTQSALMGAVQYWITPQFWIKGGLGFANLQISGSDTGDMGPGTNGLAIMGAAGFEVFSARNFSIDIQGRVIRGSYNSTNADGSTSTFGQDVTAGSIGVGVNWY